MGRPRVLLAWELGAGFGHSTKLARIGARLAAAGCEVVAALPDLALAGPLHKAGIPVLPTPHLAPAPPVAQRTSARLTDSLIQAGLMGDSAVQQALAGWQRLLDEMQPHLLVLDYAPLATVAARGRAAIMQSSVGYCLPPDHLDAFPRLHHIGPDGASDTALLASLNQALGAADMAPIPRLGALFSGDDIFVGTFQLLDPYADDRARPAEGPLLDEPLRPARPDAAAIFAYLHPDVVERDHVHAALCELGPALEIYAPRVPEVLLAPLRTAGARVHDAPQRVADVLERSRLVIHQGNAGLAAEALAAGVPQYALCWHVEHYINAEALAAAGVARSRNLFDPAFRLDAGDILDFARDAEAAFMAEAAGRIHRAMLAEADPLETLTRRCLALLQARGARPDQ